MYNIYVLINPIDNSPFYVGCTKKKLKVRLCEHIGTPGYDTGFLKEKEELIKKIFKNKLYPIIKLLRVVSFDKIDHYESFYYRKFLRAGNKMLQAGNRMCYQIQQTKSIHSRMDMKNFLNESENFFIQ